MRVKKSPQSFSLHTTLSLNKDIDAKVVAAYQLAGLPSPSEWDLLSFSLWDLFSPDCRTPLLKVWLPANMKTHKENP